MSDGNGFRDFVRETRQSPGIGLRVMSALALGLAVVANRGWTGVVVLLAAAIAMPLLGFGLWRARQK